MSKKVFQFLWVCLICMVLVSGLVLVFKQLNN